MQDVQNIDTVYLIENNTNTTYQVLKVRNVFVMLQTYPHQEFDATKKFQKSWDRMLTTVLHHLFF